MSVIIVAAVRFEAEPLLQKLELMGMKATFVEIGIGAINAARASEKLQTAVKGKDVILVGTCGTFGKFSEPLLVRACRTLWLPACVRASIAWSIEGIDPPIDLPDPPIWAKSLPTATVICGPTIAKSPLIPEPIVEHLNLWNHSHLVENLELYSCIASLASSARSMVSVLGITNAVGPDGRQQWRHYFKTLATMTAEYIGDHIR